MIRIRLNYTQATMVISSLYGHLHNLWRQDRPRNEQALNVPSGHVINGA